MISLGGVFNSLLWNLNDLRVSFNCPSDGGSATNRLLLTSSSRSSFKRAISSGISVIWLLLIFSRCKLVILNNAGGKRVNPKCSKFFVRNNPFLSSWSISNINIVGLVTNQFVISLRSSVLIRTPVEVPCKFYTHKWQQCTVPFRFNDTRVLFFFTASKSVWLPRSSMRVRARLRPDIITASFLSISANWTASLSPINATSLKSTEFSELLVERRLQKMWVAE